MTKKYELIKYDIVMYRVAALRDIPRHGVKAGDLGGLVYGSHNLSQEGDCWLDVNSKAIDNSIISGNALLVNSYTSNSSHVADNAIVTNCRILHRSSVSGKSRITGVVLLGDALIRGDVCLSCDIKEYMSIRDNACISKQEDILILGPARSSGRCSAAYRQIDGSIQVTTGCFRGTLDEYAQAIKRRHSGINRTQYLDFHKQFKQYFGLTKRENPFLRFLKHLY